MIKPFQFLYRKLLEHDDQGYDLILLGSMALLVLGGLMMIYSASSPVSDRLHGSSLYLLRHHLVHLGLGLVGLWVAMRIPYQRWQQWAPYLLVGVFALLIVVLIPGIGYQVGGARRWLRLGALNFQPTELLKLVMIVYVASYLNRKPGMVAQFFRGVLPNFAVMGVFLALVILQPDFGTVVLIAMTLLLMIFVGGAKPGHILASLAGFGVIGAWLVASQSYRLRRIFAFLDPWGDPLNTGFQIVQSYLAFGNGGVFGVGLGDSRQKLFFLPDAHTDFIFSIVGEELGLIGVLAAMVLFAIFLWRGYRICLTTEDDFGRYLAYGITTLFTLQILLNLAVVMGMMPTKGLPLPFISYGGSSLLGTLFMTGVLLNIGRRPKRWAATDAPGLAGAAARR
ncbi:MAG TPA: putative lipid II flippase FtsW [bacterium]|nr:putative lipid II flippase FtsW [bacterium]